jgi:hypothetical protein
LSEEKNADLNGRFDYDEEKNDRPSWVKTGTKDKISWNGNYWECKCGALTPSVGSNLPVPPLSGYEKSE